MYEELLILTPVRILLLVEGYCVGTAAAAGFVSYGGAVVFGNRGCLLGVSPSVKELRSIVDTGLLSFF